jgi:predicted amidohydrolase
MPLLPVTVVQAAAALDPERNRARLPALLDGHEGLVVLPEAFARDFGPPGSDVAPYAEPLDGPFVDALVRAAGRTGVTAVAGLFERGDDPARPYNTLVVADGDGVRAAYRKIHLYDSFGYRESDALSAGPVDQTPVVAVAEVPVALMTCYDLRFPELARRLAVGGAALLVVPAAWVAGPRKVRHWETLLTARAVENTVYVAAAAQPPPRYTGHSVLLDPRGDVLAGLADEEEAAASATVDTAVMEEARAENPSLANRRISVTGS